MTYATQSSGPASNDLDFRFTRDIPIYRGVHMQLIGEAFNLVNHKIVASVNSTYSTYTPATATSKCNLNSAAPTDSTFTGSIIPCAGTGTSAFGHVSDTNNVLYGARQLQVSAKLFF